MKEQEKENGMVELQAKVLSPQVIAMQDKFLVACNTARDMKLQDNACAAFQAVCVVAQLREALSEEVMKAVFMPLMNTAIGFRTDKDPSRPVKQKDGSYKAPEPYGIDVVRNSLIEAISMGLMPTGNQFNIIAGRCYPTKEGYTALLKKMGCKYVIQVGQDQQRPDAPFAEIACKINYDYDGDKGGYSIIAVVKKDGYSSADQLRGKAERRAKKSLYEYLTGCDFGDADEDSGAPASAGIGQQIGISKQLPEQQADQQPQPTQREAMENASRKAEAAWRNPAAPSNDGPGY